MAAILVADACVGSFGLVRDDRLLEGLTVPHSDYRGTRQCRVCANSAGNRDKESRHPRPSQQAATNTGPLCLRASVQRVGCYGPDDASEPQGCEIWRYAAPHRGHLACWAMCIRFWCSAPSDSVSRSGLVVQSTVGCANACTSGLAGAWLAGRVVREVQTARWNHRHHRVHHSCGTRLARALPTLMESGGIPESVAF
jgi:hypothetical protein